MNDSTPAVTSYALEMSEQEYARLDAQSEVWSGATTQALAGAGLAAGMSALDVGCGTGAALRQVARIVGPTGAVVGLDQDARLGPRVLQRMAEEGVPNRRFVEADLTRVESVDGAPFDLVYARMVLHHLADPVSTLRKLWQWVKPGGTLLIQDLDFSVMRGYPAEFRGNRAAELLRKIYSGLGIHIDIGSRMPLLFVEAGIGIPDTCEVFGLIPPAAPGGGMVRAVLGSVRSAAVERGIVDAATMDAIDADLASVRTGDGFGRWPDLVATRRRKPD